MTAPLANIRILEIGHYIAAPYCAQLLADMGAEVIKIERPGGEAARDYGPFHNGESLYYTSYNRNKLGITLDLKSEEGKKTFIELVKKSDVVIENQRPGLMKKMGFSYEELSEINPAIIYNAISGYGQNGIYKDRPALDMIMQAFGGIMSMTGLPENPPTKVGVAIVDFVTAMYSAMGIVAALYARRSTGRGQMVDVAMLDSLFTILENFPASYMLDGFVPPRVGNTRVVTGPSNSYKTKDGYIYIAAVADSHFKLLMDVIGYKEVGCLPEYDTSAKRKIGQAYLDDIISGWTSQQTTEYVFKALSDIGVPAAPVNTIPDLVNDPHLREREMIVELPHPNIDSLPMIGNPIKFSATPVEMKSAPPLVGEHNDYVLSEVLGYSREEIEAMRGNTAV